MITIKLIILLLGFVVVAKASPTEDDSTKVVQVPIEPIPAPALTDLREIELSVEVVELPILADSVIVDLLCNTNGMAIGGMDLLVGTNSHLIEIVAVESGQMQIDNRWTMFNATQARSFSDEKLWHIVSLARSMSMGDAEASLSWAGEASVARLVLHVNQPEMSNDSLHSIQFYWRKCSDNSISDSTGSNLLVGHLGEMAFPVTNASGYEGGSQDQTGGPPPDCFKRATNRPADIITFNGGGLILRTNITIPEPADSTSSKDSPPPAQINDLK